MYTSDTDERTVRRTEMDGLSTAETERRARRCAPAGTIAFTYLEATAVCAVIGLIYELFSHGVWSAYMGFGFLVPLVLGALPNFLIWLAGAKAPRPAAEVLYACGVATLTVGSLLNGVLAIYGTTNTLIRLYPLIGGLLAFLGAILYITQKKKAEV